MKAIVLSGFGGPEVLVPAEAAADHGVRVTGIMVEPDRADLESIAALIGEGRLRARSPRSFPLREAAGAHRALESKEIRGKAVLVP